MYLWSLWFHFAYKLKLGNGLFELFFSCRCPSSFSASREGSERSVGGQSATRSWSQLLQSQSEVQRKPRWQYDHPSHQSTRPAWQRRQHFQHAYSVRDRLYVKLGLCVAVWWPRCVRAWPAAA